MDASKVIAAAVYYDGNRWDMIFTARRNCAFRPGPCRSLPCRPWPLPVRNAQFARRIFGASTGQDDLNYALEDMNRFEKFLCSIGCQTRLSELNIVDELLARYARDALRIANDGNGKLPGRPLMSEADIIEVLRSSL